MDQLLAAQSRESQELLIDAVRRLPRSQRSPNLSLARIGLALSMLGAAFPAAAGLVFSSPEGSPYSVGSNPLVMDSADFNNDGRADLAIANYYSDSVSVLLADTAGAFSSASGAPVAVVAHPSALALGDVNGDGNADIVVMDNESQQVNQSGTPDQVMVLLGDGTGTFASAGQFVVGPDPTSVAIGDLDGDGLADLAITNTRYLNDTYQQEILIQPGVGDGTFDTVNEVRFVTREAIYPCRANPAVSCTIATPRSIRIADVNEDGAADLVTAQPGTKDVGVWLGDGAFGFAAAPGAPIPFTRFVQAVATGDFNADGHVDLAVGHATFYSVSILLGDGGGGFVAAAGSPVATTGAANAVGIGDFDGDGRADVAASGDNGSVGAVNVLLGDGTGRVVPISGSPVVVDGMPNEIVVADFNADGFADLASVSNQTETVTVLLAVDTTPEAFTFTDQADVARSSTITSNSITVSGINDAAAISVVGGEYSMGCTGTFTTTAATINDGQTVCVRHTSADADNTATDTVLTVGGVSDTFTSTTGDYTPAAFNFSDQTAVAISALITSDAITVSGITAATAISISGGEYSIDDGDFTSTDGMISKEQFVRVRHTSASGFSGTTTTTLTIGGLSADFSSTTLAQDTTPDAFTFTPVGDVARNSVQTSEAVTIGGINDAAVIGVSDGTYSIGCTGTFTATESTITDGQTVCVRHTAASGFSTTTTTTLTVGGVSNSFTSTTVAASPGGESGGGGGLSSLLLAGLAGLAGLRAIRRRSASHQ